MLRQIILFPDAPHLISTSSLRLTKFQILLELECGFVGFLAVSQREIPSVDQIMAIVPTLSEAINGSYTLAHASDLIFERHELSAEVLDGHFAEIASWNVDSVVNGGLASVAAIHGSVAPFELSRLNLKDIKVELQNRIDQFLTRLDAEILGLLPKKNVIPSLYNYLVGGDLALHRNRMQSARLFPWVMEHVLWNNNMGNLPSRIHKAIDEGLPLIDTLASAFKVSPHVIKILSRCPASVFANVWKGNVKRLSLAIKETAPEFLPRSDEEWLRMGEVVDFIEKITNGAVSRPQNRLQLSSLSRSGFNINVADADALLVEFADMRSALCQVLSQRVARQEGREEGWLTQNPSNASIIKHVITRTLERMHLLRLLELVRRWRDAYRRWQDFYRRKMISLDRYKQHSKMLESSWRAPLNEFCTENRIVVPLLTEMELIFEGDAMNHCVGGYVQQCRTGEVQIWSIRALDNLRRSTLETHIWLDDSGWKVRVVQNRAFSNQTPDASSTLAANALIRILLDSHDDLELYSEWRKSLPPPTEQRWLSDMERTFAMESLTQSLEEVLPKNMSLKILEAEVVQALNV